MQTTLAAEYEHSPLALSAQDLVRQCVHCGFCTATCPTYELDGPRGRIYLIRQVLQGETPTRSTQEHLDRCLTCRSCESTCPSGVQYGHLIDVGRALVDDKVQRPWLERVLRGVLVHFLTSPLFAPAYRVGQWMRPVLPKPLQAKVSPWVSRQPHAALERIQDSPLTGHKILFLEGCVQPALCPNPPSFKRLGCERHHARGCGLLRRLGPAPWTPRARPGPNTPQHRCLVAPCAIGRERLDQQRFGLRCHGQRLWARDA